MAARRRNNSSSRTRSVVVRAALSAGVLLGSTGIAAGLAGGCGGDGASTTGRRVVLHTKIQADSEIQGAFETGVGWTVTLTKAAVAVGSLYYFDGEPAFVQNNAGPASGVRFAELFGLGVAHAHPGHYQAGDAKGQMLVPSSFDLFAGAGAMADGEGISGDVRSARFVLADKTVGPAAAVLGAHVAIAEGTAEKTDGSSPEPIHFVVSGDFAEVAKSVTKGEVDGCEFEETDVEGDGTVTLTIKPSIWFNLVDFSDVDPGTADAPTEIAHGETAQVGFALGLVQLTAYSFAYSK